jgi:hypothetical protein
MRVDSLVPRAEKLVLVLEAIGDNKVRINSTSLDIPLVILDNQALEVVAVGKQLHVGPATAGGRISEHRPDRLLRRGLRSGNEVGAL